MSIEPDLAELIGDAIEAKLLDVHTACVGKIVSYDSATQTADVQLVVRRPLPVADGSYEQEDIPILPSVPIVWLGGGGFALHFPLAKGDAVLVVFSEASIAMWRETDQVTDVGDVRRHSLGHAIAIPCIRPVKAPIAPTDLSATDAILNGPGGVRLGGVAAVFVALSTLVDARIEQLRSALDTHVHPTGVGPSGPTAAPLGPLATVAATKVKAE